MSEAFPAVAVGLNRTVKDNMKKKKKQRSQFIPTIPTMPITTHPFNCTYGAIICILEDSIDKLQVLYSMYASDPVDYYIPVMYRDVEARFGKLKGGKSHPENENTIFKREFCIMMHVLQSTLFEFKFYRHFHRMDKTLRTITRLRIDEHTLIAELAVNEELEHDLNAMLHSERKYFKEMISMLHHEVNKLQYNEYDNSVIGDIETKFVTRWENARNGQNDLVLKTQEDKFSDEISDCITKMCNEMRIHNEIEAYIELTEEELQYDVENWIHKYDTDLEKIEADIQKLRTERDDQLIRLLSLKEKYDETQLEIDNYKAYKEEKAREELLFVIYTIAARRIQKYWRRYIKMKKIAEEMAKKAKSGKKKGQKKKKK